MTESVRAAVMIGAKKTRVKTFPVPEIGATGGLLEVEASGVCGADAYFYADETAPERILGHEVIGTIIEVGPESSQTWGLQVGDRVVMEEYLPCGHCRFCMTSDYRLCLSSDPFAVKDPLRYGMTGTAVKPSLWGGYAEKLYLHPKSVFHRAPDDVPAEVLAMSLPFGNGYEWTVRAGETKPGSTVLILGPGQQGLGCVTAAAAAGAETIILAGLEQDAHRLRAAHAIGATHTLAVGDDLVAAVDEITGGEGVDLAIDAAAGSAATVLPALRCIRKAGRFVLAMGGQEPVPVPMNKIHAQNITISAVRGHSWESVEWAIRTLSQEPQRYKQLATHQFGLDQVDDALRLLSHPEAQEAIHISVTP